MSISQTIIPVIHTERAILRAHIRADFEAFAHIWADPGVTRFIGGTPFSYAESWSRFLRNAGLWSIVGYGYWAIEERAGGAYLGLAGLADFERGIAAIKGIPEAGWVLAPQADGRGLASEVVAAILCWADEGLKAPETCCIIDPGHGASKRVAEKNGFASAGLADYGETQIEVFKRPRCAS
ncbi:GNAT family N-acetyltransferase [Sphingobium boeckii]|uniref:RimJ/RimL family protein N-acetyltransferase n=1 Tax=Sphingobium boeckii TaxID=1082345 RepID=A0A7W9AGU2_9SPHN|nr:GNAT family N-acetyltransferase [Sphingobium boeckii]MBB5685394.1 RimJ/RimL family protein N-acetyltransferase [Sphingobium boeckii]